ncbi:MAG: sigma-70 family RNA polymerase sigma factor [Planctomycetota bacterium]|nr:MAG: sigma-70 family RNA polymerase sigma factor [Planctomycetota bacterium]
MDGQSEEQLVAACRGGDKSAYASPVRRYAPQVFAICLGMLGNAHDAEDLAQEALVKGFTRIGELRDSERFAAWIRKIARHLCLDFIRRQKLGRQILAGQVEQNQTRPSDYPDLHQAITRLPEQYRLPLMLYYFDGQDTAGVARTLNLTQAAVCARLSRARKELRRLLGQRGGVQ